MSQSCPPWPWSSLFGRTGASNIEAAGRLAIDDQKESGAENSFAGKHCDVRRGECQMFISVR
ncbi:hypothetical protein MESS4_110157 [Mesorhizobium sp. STM 4661]|nr:hypothetical protein MESS4_110157 [Mesorhizobium sp. STM 4661]